MNFSEVLNLLKRGNKVARSGWIGKNMWVAVQYPDDYSKMTLPYLYMRTAQGDFIPWTISQADVFAVDWSVIDTTES